MSATMTSATEPRSARRRARVLCMFGSILLAVSASPPSRADDCCNDFWSCAAAVASSGLSCIVLTILDAVKALVASLSQTHGQLQSDVQGALTSAQNDTVTALAQISDSVAGNINSVQGATAAAVRIVADEKRRVTTVAGNHATSAVVSTAQSAPQNSSGASIAWGTPAARPWGAPTGTPAGGMAPHGTLGVPSPSPAATAATTLHSGKTALHSPVSALPSGSSATPGASNVARQEVSALQSPVVPATGLTAPATPFDQAVAAEFARCAQQLQVSSQRATQAQMTALAAMKEAQAAEAADAAQAQNLANQLILTPLEDIITGLLAFLAAPFDFDPTTQAAASVAAIADGLDGNLTRIEARASQDSTPIINAAQPHLDYLAGAAVRTQAVAAAMKRVYEERTESALQALESLVPPPKIGTQDLATELAVPIKTGGVLAPLRARAQARISAAHGKLVSKYQPGLQQLSTRLRALQNANAGHGASSLVLYRQRFNQQMNTYLGGKPAASQMDRLIAEARTRYAHSPKTMNAVIQLLRQSGKPGAAN